MEIVKSREESERVYKLFCDLADIHVYFELLRLEWKLCLDRAQYMGYEFPQNFLQVKYLDEMPDRLLTLQRQALDLLTQIWITDTSEKSVGEKMAACYLVAEQAGKELFRFQLQRMSYELLYQETLAEILCPETVYDLIDYHLRECLKREIKMRVCKNCGRLFAVTGHGGTEYCDRPFDEKAAPARRSEYSVFGKRARAMTRCSKFTAGSTRNALPGLGLAGLRRTNSTPGARKPERKKWSVRMGRSHWMRLGSG